jgi:phospholipid transport system substrate-binding protein
MLRLLLVCLTACSLAAPVVAQETPDVLVKSVTQEVLAIVRADKEIQSGNTRKTIALVEEKVLPHFNFTRMTALAMGPNWRKATPEQQKQLVDQFRTLLVRTYSSALTQYRNQTIDFKPLRMQPADNEVMVRSEVKQSGAEPIGIDYAMEKTAAGWKVYDVSVAGVSLVTTYRDTFASEVRNAGVDGLIKTLGEKNRQLGTKSG